MRLERLIQQNWCKVAAKDSEFHPGMNVLLGPNGSGKSNTLNGVIFALTGDFSRNAGTKLENVYRLQPEGPSSVRLIFTHNNMRFDVLRGLVGVQTRLTVSDTTTSDVLEEVRGENKVTKRLTELLNVNPSILADYVFVGQGKMFEMFDPAITPAARTVAFQQLFGLDRLEALWIALGEQISALPVITAPERAPYLMALTQAQSAFNVHEQRVLSLQDIANWRQETDPDYALTNQAAQISTVRTALAYEREHRYYTTQQRWAARKALRTSQVQYNSILAGITAMDQTMLLRSQTILEAYRAQAQADLTLQEACAVYEQAQQAYSTALGTPLAQPDGEAMTVEGLNRQIHQVERDIAVDDELILQIGSGDKCPTCGQALADGTIARREEKLRRLEANRLSLITLQELRSVWQTYETAQMRRTQQLSVLLTRLEAAQTRKESAEQHCMDMTVSEADVAWANTTQQQHQTLTRGRDQLCGVLSAQQQSYAQARRAMKQHSARVRELYRELMAAPSAEEIQAASQRLQNRQACWRDYTVAVAQRDASRQALDHATQSLRGVDELHRSATESQRLRNRLQTTRDVLQRDNLPRVLLQQRLLAVGQDTNAALELFGAQFRLEPREDRLSYRAIFFDGIDQPIERLSGGEKVITALAFRIAVNARFASQLGLLCLDEPTVYLDSDNVQCLEPALMRLRQHAQTTGLQCVLITHENVGHLFDHVINCP